MLLGAYDRAWKESDTIRSRGAVDPHRVWDGTPLAGQRVLVRSVHGYGDAVQMLRYCPHIRKQATRLTVQVAPRLAELVRLVPSIDEVIMWEEERPFDAQLEMTELPYVFRSTLETLPAAVNFPLTTPLKLAARQILLDRRRPRIGVAWAGGAWDAARSIPFALLSPLFAIEGEIDFWCLQPGETSGPWHDLCAARGWEMRQLGECSLGTLAACVAELDLVITIDSFFAHLAGTLGRPVWVLLKQQSDWRWMLDRGDSPWYPTMRLFRQQEEGAWQPVVARVAQELELWLATQAMYQM